MNRKTLSVIVITKNEEQKIYKTLKAVDWADEIIVLDSGSTDRTLEISKTLATKVISTDWQGFGVQKNRALSHASCEWVLSIDADEYVSPELTAEITKFLTDTKDFTSCTIPRLSTFIGKPVWHSGWWPDPVCRLFLRTKGKFTNHLVHEKLEVTGKSYYMKCPLMHESYTSIEQLISKMNHYSSAGAVDLSLTKKNSSLRKAVLKGAWAFLRTYFFKFGFLDGRAGLIIALYNSHTTYYKYLKLMYLQNNEIVKYAKPQGEN